MALFCTLFPPHHPPGTALFFSLSEGSATQKHHQNNPGVSPKILPSEGGFYEKKTFKISASTPEFSPEIPPGVPSKQPQKHLRSNRNLLKKRLYFGSFSLILLKNFPRAILLEGELMGRDTRGSEWERRLRSDLLKGGKERGS